MQPEPGIISGCAFHVHLLFENVFYAGEETEFFRELDRLKASNIVIDRGDVRADPDVQLVRQEGNDMVSRRNYLTIAMMFVILLFMFQFTGVMKEQLSEYESNEYADDTTTSFQRSDAFLAEQTSADACEVIYVGEAGERRNPVVKTWCSYRKRTFLQQLPRTA